MKFLIFISTYLITLINIFQTNPVVDLKNNPGNQQLSEIEIVDGTYENRPHFIIKTSTATYYYDKAGGGFSRMLDADRTDWINYKTEPWDTYPASAASAYRGIPNLVFGSDDSGAGHPGHNKCISKQLNNHTIFTESTSGKWQWRWDFFEQYAQLTMLKIDSIQPYWFLYEGTPGGIFKPSDQYFGNNKGGPFTQTPDYYKGDQLFDHWQWFYVGAKNSDHTLFMLQIKPDDLSDTFSYLGNTDQGILSNDGMVVFGFGRAEGAKPLLNGANTYILGFYNNAIFNNREHRKISRYIEWLSGSN